MASNFWIKLYHEILHDPKMGRLPDNVWRRAIELFLLAGELDDNGNLPNTEDLAWHLHRPNIEEFETELTHLEKVGILTRLDNGWLVTKFVERQKAISDSERAKAYRDRKRKEPASQEDNEPVTPPSRDSHEPVTNRDADIDKDILPKGNSDKSPEILEEPIQEPISEPVSTGNVEEPTEKLSADTPESRLLFAKINQNRAAKKRNNLKRFASLEQKQKCLEAGKRLGYIKFSEGIETALANGVEVELKALVNWIAKYTGEKNGLHPTGPAIPRASPTRPKMTEEEERAAFLAHKRQQEGSSV